MRDDFTQENKNILAKRVGLLCSNPNCRSLTIGPNSDDNKTISIGVAAHITAASYSGPRYDEKLNSVERRSINNAIWLCQSCAKLIDSDTGTYTIEVLRDWKKETEVYISSLLNVPRRENPTKSNFSKVLSLMPKLFDEMKNDIIKNPLARELILQSKSWRFNHSKQILVYYYEEHENLDEKIVLLENNGFVKDITFNKTKRYILSEEFVELLRRN